MSSYITLMRTKPSLPLDIVVDILTRLSMDTILRFRSVCKLWSNLIYDPSFGYVHTRRSHPQPGLIIPIRSIYDECLYQRPKFFDMSTMKLRELPALEDCHHGKANILSLKASCNGLLLLEIKNSRTQITFRVANLITRRCITIPFPPNYNPCRTSRFPSSYSTSFGLAYDDAAAYRKYKVVCCSNGRMCVLSLGMGENSWRDVEIHHQYKLDAFNLARFDDHVFVNGHLYWMVRIDENPQRASCILTMEVGREAVYVFAPPMCEVKPRHQILFDMNSSLCFASKSPNSFGFQIWVLKDLKDWIKGFNIHLTHSEFIHFHNGLLWIAYVGEPKCEIILCSGEKILRYDVKRRRRLTIVLLPESIPWMLEARMHVNTLDSW